MVEADHIGIGHAARKFGRYQILNAHLMAPQGQPPHCKGERSNPLPSLLNKA
jgi:hypothetical protein